MDGAHNQNDTRTTWVVSGPLTQVIKCWPEGWTAIRLGYLIGLGFAVGVFSAACIILALSKIGGLLA